MTDDTRAAARRQLAEHFRRRAGALLAAWKAAVAAEPTMKTGRALPRAQLEDHLPKWLDDFATVLGIPFGAAGSQAADQETRNAESHGLQRWQQGYDLHEVTREWGFMHHCLVVELEAFTAAHPEIALQDLGEARLKLAEQISEATSASAEQYFRLERIEASGNVRDLEQALADVRALETTRAELWQQAAHDLRGNLGVVSNVAAGLAFRDMAPERRQNFLGLLRNNVVALRLLLDDVTALARLQAGQEQRKVAEFDAAALLRGLCDDVRPVAEEKQLVLDASGPARMLVEGDAVKVRRIAQNLVLNALKYTRVGRVAVSWADSPGHDDSRWMLVVEDTGPGFHAGPGAPLISALTQATSEGHAVEQAASGEAVPADPVAAPVDSREAVQVGGEGIGLSIVKRLCELLDAAIDLESSPGRGTVFRILLPRRYGA